ncbi:hypothetical protein TNCV_1248491 [Trichonephila clavipes]|nr:hypothetical protein TNCV_1248491 [Trichonephila clavipes]
MDEDCTTKKVFNAQPIGTHRKSRPNLRWTDSLENSLLVLRTKEISRKKASWEGQGPPWVVELLRKEDYAGLRKKSEMFGRNALMF